MYHLEPSTVSTAYLLIAHGSRDPRPQAAMNRLAQLVREKLSQEQSHRPVMASNALRPLNRSPLNASAWGASASPFTTPSVTTTLPRPEPSVLSPAAIVGTAVLECGPLSLKQQICEFGNRVKAAGIQQLKLVPIFLMAGVHVVDDIPAEVSAAQQQLGSELKLSLCDHLGSQPGLKQLLQDRLALLPRQGQLLVAHGSRKRHGNRAVEAVAKRLGTAIAYWSIPPDIESQVVMLMQQGAQTVTILPYFLFPGGITDAVAHRTEELAERFPKVKFRLLPPLGASSRLADIIVDFI